MNEPIKLVTTRPDIEVAAEHKEAILKASTSFMEALTNARKDGFVTQVSFGENAFQQIVIISFSLVKMF